jgi:glycosyltransferase involved in cell wall biosynthesis
MKILILIHSLRRSGAERVTLEIALGLKNNGHDIYILMWKGVNEYQDVRYSNIDIGEIVSSEEYSWPWSIPKSAIKLHEKVRAFNPDIIQIHSPNCFLLCAWANLRLPAIHVIHGYSMITNKADTYKDKIKHIINIIADRVVKPKYITVAEPMIKHTKAYFRLPNNTCQYIYNGVDLEEYKPSERRLDETLIFLMIGTLQSEKGHIFGIEAFIKILIKFPDAILKIVGDGDERPKLEALVKSNGLECKVDFLGIRNDIPEILQSANVLLHMSDKEAMPMVIIEAMATGLPVIGFNVPGVRDTVSNNETGYLIHYGDVDQVAQVACNLLQDFSLYRNMSIKAYERTQDLFGLENMIDNHESALFETIRTNKNKLDCNNSGGINFR